MYVAILTAILLATFKREIDHYRIAEELRFARKAIQTMGKDIDQLRWLNVELEDYVYLREERASDCPRNDENAFGSR